MRHYKLIGKLPVPCSTIMEWALWWETADASRRVAFTEIGTVHVSTVFIGMDLGFGEGDEPPLLFETMAFCGSDEDIACQRCSTWEEAEAQHARVLAWAVQQVRDADVAISSLTPPR